MYAGTPKRSMRPLEGSGEVRLNPLRIYVGVTVAAALEDSPVRPALLPSYRLLAHCRHTCRCK